MTGPEALRRDHIIVCGLHDLGLRVVEQLCIAGETVVVADDRPNPALTRTCEQVGAEFLPASGRRPGTLEAAGLATAAALVCTDESDLVNLEIALLARRLRPDVRVVVQLGNESVGRAVARVTGPASVLDVATIAAPTLAEACLDLRRRPLDIGGEAFVLRELDAPDAGTLRELYGDLAPVAVVPADDGPMHVCPGRDLAVAAGDRVVVLGSAADLEKPPPARRRPGGAGAPAPPAGAGLRPQLPGLVGEAGCAGPCGCWSPSPCCRSSCCAWATAPPPGSG